MKAAEVALILELDVTPAPDGETLSGYRSVKGLSATARIDLLFRLPPHYPIEARHHLLCGGVYHYDRAKKRGRDKENKTMTLRTGSGSAGFHIGNSIVRKLLLVSAALIVALPASAAVRFVGGGFRFGPAFGPWGYGYEPYYYGAYPLVTHPDTGLVKLDTKVKGAEVFVNGAFAGTAGDLKSMWLRQGSYNLEVRSPGRARFAERIYVVNGKTLHVRPDLRVEPKS